MRQSAATFGALLLVVAAGGGCVREDERRDTIPPDGDRGAPVGEAEYRRILHEQADLDLRPRELATLASKDAVWLSDRMDALAGGIGQGGVKARVEAQTDGWRTAFEPLREDHPPEAGSILAAYREEAERARRFVEAHGLVTVPPGRLEVVRTPEAIPAGRYTFVGYLGYRLAVTIGEGARLRDHCRVCIPPLAAHETYPGHHVAFLYQRSGSAVGDEAAARAAEHLTNPFFHEAWGQYAELLMLEQGYYEGQPERELGAWRSLLFRVERARIDALLHAGEMRPDEAARALEPFLDQETAEEEVARHLSEPGAKAAYYVGLLQVLALREAVERADNDRGERFDLRAFHDRLVRLPGPIPALARERFGVELPAEPVPLRAYPL